ncbi:MAG: hypothetical protein II896_03370 [Clostridia bacterium]|nr:hypothetical protein [Clostridia bacterium]
MKRPFFKRINIALTGGCTIVIGLIINLLCWIFDAKTLVPLWIVFIILLICYLIIIIVYALLKNPKTEMYRLPAVKTIYFEDADPVFIVEPNELYGQGALVTIVFQADEDSIETILGVGFIETINDKQYRQIRFYERSKNENAQEKLKFLNQDHRKCIKIKPYVTKQILQDKE